MPWLLRTKKLLFLLTDNGVGCPVSPPKQHKVTFKLDPEIEQSLESSSSISVKAPQLGEFNFAVCFFLLFSTLYNLVCIICTDCVCVARGKAKLSSPAKQVEEVKRLEGSSLDSSHVALLSPGSSPISRSPGKGELMLYSFLHSYWWQTCLHSALCTDHLWGMC